MYNNVSANIGAFIFFFFLGWYELQEFVSEREIAI